MDINDPLHLSSQGVKKDYSDKISKYYSDGKSINGSMYSVNKNKRYYPVTNRGVIDEWAAITNGQVENAYAK